MILTPIKSEDFPVSVASAGTESKNIALTDSRSITEVSSVAAQSVAVLALRKLKGLIADTEKSRVEVKAPVLEIGRKIDSLAKEFSADIEAEANRLTGLLKKFSDEQARIAREAEQKRLAEIARIEAEKQRLAREEAVREYKRQEAIRIAAAEVERARQAELARIAEARRKAEAEAAEIARKAAEREDALIAAQAAQKAPSVVARVAATVDKANRAAEEVQQSIRALDSLAANVATAPIPEAQLTPEQIIEECNAEEAQRALEAQEKQSREAAQWAAQQVAVKPAGMVSKKVWKFEITDLHELYSYSENLVRIEPNVEAINKEIRITEGRVKIPGLRIWEETDVTVRR